jgi:hypothetical protein
MAGTQAAPPVSNGVEGISRDLDTREVPVLRSDFLFSDPLVGTRESEA